MNRTPRAKRDDRVRDVITGLSEGRSLKEIAFQWHRSVKTVEHFWAVAKAAFGLRCYQDATRYALKRGWTTL